MKIKAKNLKIGNFHLEEGEIELSIQEIIELGFKTNEFIDELGKTRNETGKPEEMLLKYGDLESDINKALGSNWFITPGDRATIMPAELSVTNVDHITYDNAVDGCVVEIKRVMFSKRQVEIEVRTGAHSGKLLNVHPNWLKLKKKK